MFNKKNFIILVIIINMIMPVCLSMNVFAGVNMAIYTSAAPTSDARGNIWVYFGTGDKTDPGATTGNERVYAVIDSDRTSTYTLSNLMDISGTSATVYPVYDPNSTTYKGWYITLSTGGEKMLAAPVVYDQKVYFTTYVPSSVPCDQNGRARLYCVNYLTGAGQFSGGARYEDVGPGIPSGAVISTNPYTGGYNVYVSTSAANFGTGSSTIMPSDTSPQSGKGKYMMYWKDNRLQ
jgi:Tfp pilus tip-associated adhesin PilY1